VGANTTSQGLQQEYWAQRLRQPQATTLAAGLELAQQRQCVTRKARINDTSDKS
jgi:hypothetical protein